MKTSVIKPLITNYLTIIMGVKTATQTKIIKKPGSALTPTLKKKTTALANPTKKPILIPKQFDPVQVKRSSKALLAHAHTTYLKSPEAQSDGEISGEPIYLNINTYEQITDRKPEGPTLIPVPNKVRPRLAKLQVCLIVNNPQKAVVDALTSDEKLPTYELFSEIISTSRLRSALSTAGKETHQHRAALDFVKNFDMLVYDGKLKPQVMRSILGPRVYNKPAGVKIQSPLPITLQPVTGPDATPVQIEEAKKVIADPVVIKKQLKFIANCVTVLPSPGTSLSILVGLSSFTKEQLIENITAVLKVVMNEANPLIDNTWGNVRAMYIKTTESASLPLYTPE